MIRTIQKDGRKYKTNPGIIRNRYEKLRQQWYVKKQKQLIQDTLETFIRETSTLEVSQNQESTEITGITPRTIYVSLEAMTDITEEIHEILDMITLTEIRITDINLEHLPSVHTDERPSLTLEIFAKQSTEGNIKLTNTLLDACN